MKITMRTFMLAVGLLILTVIPAWASQGSVGESPYAADLLVSGLNTGSLDPGQEYWYAYSRLDLGDPAYNAIILSLNFEAKGRAIASRVNFQVLNFAQVEAWLADNSGPVDSLGLGTPASTDFDANTGERLWAGPVDPNEVYYVRIFNLSPSPVQFRLTALGQKSSQLANLMPASSEGGQQPAVIPAAMNITTETPEPATGAAVETAAIPIEPDDASPASTGWLLAAQAIDGLPPQQAAAWLMSAARLGWLPHTGPALMPVNPTDGQPLVAGGEGNGAGSADVSTVPVAPDPLRGDSIYPSQPLRLLYGTNTGRVAPNAEHWYTFVPDSPDHTLVENLSLTMFFTPGEPNLARYVTFELYTGSQYQIWDRGTPEDMEHFGAGSWVSRDWDYNTGERLWHGTVVNGDQYFVKITNTSGQWIDYHLMTGDIINTELGPHRAQSALINQDTTPTGADIGSPLPIETGHTTGHLAAGEDTWYSFRHQSFDQDEFEFDRYQIKLEHTPGAGYVTNHVNVEIYPYQEQHIWQRGDTDQIQPLGTGRDLAYNDDTDTHTWVWDGHLVSNTIYFMRVRNNSSRAIDYDLLIHKW